MSCTRPMTTDLEVQSRLRILPVDGSPPRITSCTISEDSITASEYIAMAVKAGIAIGFQEGSLVGGCLEYADDYNDSLKDMRGDES